MDDNESCPSPILQGIGSLSGSAMIEKEKEEEEDWAAKQRNDCEGGARYINLSPAAASKKNKTGRKNNNNSWYSISSSSSGCMIFCKCHF